MTSDINPVNVTVLIAFTSGLLLLDRKKFKHRVLLGILTVMMATEIMFIIARYAGFEAGKYLTYSIIMTFALWLIILGSAFGNLYSIRYFIMLFGSLALVNLVFVEGTEQFNFKTFILGSLIYLGILFFKSFRRLSREELDFFLSNDFLLACSPVLLFFGLSLIFAFKDLKIGDHKIYGGLNLYDFLISIMNLSYYWLIILYTYREFKLTDAK